jgi:hypothetical protein
MFTARCRWDAFRLNEARSTTVLSTHVLTFTPAERLGGVVGMADAETTKHLAALPRPETPLESQFPRRCRPIHPGRTR